MMQMGRVVMRLRVALLIVVPMLALAGQEQKSPPPPPTKPKAAAKSAKKTGWERRSSTATKGAPAKSAPAPVVIPAGAEEIRPNTFRHRDEKGRTWIYRRTPFGIAKFEEKKVSTDATATSAGITAIEQGENIKFVRRTPFGETVWTRKKTELSAEEQQALERSRKAAPDAKAGGKVQH